jgi:hypothetical protein
VSLSNPNENGQPNPSTRWFEWNGEKGLIRYYDKEQKQNVEIGNDFTFILLDQLAKVGGWHNDSDSGIYSNEVKDTRQDVLVVRSFKGGTIAEGHYSVIKDAVKAAGGKFVANLYIAVKIDGILKIASLQFSGAALHTWAEFQKAHRADLTKKAVRINGSTEGKKGRIVFHVPNFAVKDIAPETMAHAVELDKQLQDFLSGYLKRTKRDQAETVARHVSDEEVAQTNEQPWHDNPEAVAAVVTDDDIPFAWLMPILIPLASAGLAASTLV